jgi:putative nucleotidyltransferase with HDIG domain
MIRPDVTLKGINTGTEELNSDLNNSIESPEDNRVFNLLHDIRRKGSQESISNELMGQILSTAGKCLKVSAASLVLFDEATGYLQFEAAIGDVSSAIMKVKPRLNQGIAHWVAKHGSPLIVNDVSADQRFNKFIDQQTNFKTISVACVPLIKGLNTIGVIEVINKIDGNPFTDTDMEALAALASMAALAIETDKLKKWIQDGYENTIRVWAAEIDAKDKYTYGHSQRVAEYTLIGARALSLSPTDLKTLEYGALLHDIGKMKIDDSIRRKSGNPTSEESAVLRNHPRAGAVIIAGIPFLKDCKQLVVQHHEKYDGSGYPFGLRGDEITMGARIIAIADTFDALTTEHPYQKASDIDTAINMLKKYRGLHFCPVALDAFLNGLSQCQNSKDNLETSLK